MMLAMAIHHLPPGYHVSIKSGRPCPKELLHNEPKWPGETADYYHGTTGHSLLRGIIRKGLKPTFGAGEASTQTAWGQGTPMVYLSRLVECACYYPLHEGMWTEEKLTVNGHCYGKPSGGEIIARDGTPPIRVVLRCISQNTKQPWHKRDGPNDQRGFMPKHVYISHIMIYAMPPNLVSGPHSRTSWRMYDSGGNRASAENHGERYVPSAWQEGRPARAQGVRHRRGHEHIHPRGHHQEEVDPDEIRPQADPHHQGVDRCAEGQQQTGYRAQRTNPSGSTGTPQQEPLQDTVPVLENTKYSIEERVSSDWHTANISEVLANHQLGNVCTQLYTQPTRPDTRPPVKGNMSPARPTESSVDKCGHSLSHTGWEDASW